MRDRRRKPETKEIKYNCAFCYKKCTKLLYKSSIVTGHKAKYCGQACMIAFMQKNALRVECEICHKVKRTQPKQQVYRNARFCSKKCKGIWMTLEAKKRHQSGIYTVAQLTRLARYSKEAKDWREAVFKRDDYTCQECKTRGTYLEADHIKPFAYFPELRYTLSNGRTLCRPCHDKTKVSYKTLRKIYAKEVQAIQEKYAEQTKKGIGIPTKTSGNKEVRERLLYMCRPQFARKKQAFRARSVAEEHTIHGVQIRLPLYEDSMHGG